MTAEGSWGTPQSGSSSIRLRDTFVGRSSEMSALRLRIDATLSGGGGLVLIAGEPGIGKTRLAEEATGYARERGARVLWGSSWEGEGAPAFWPWVQVLRSLATGSSPASWRVALGNSATDIAIVIPELRDSVPALDICPDLPDSDPTRFRFFDSFASFLRRLGASQPLVIVLDDLH